MDAALSHVCRLTQGFIGRSKQEQINWRGSPGTALDVPELLDAAERFGHGRVNVVAIDIPIATKKIERRRIADQEISREFGSAWAGTHSPTADRPGEYGQCITRQFIDAGFSLTTEQAKPASMCLIETYPLAALVRLLGVAKRPPYKTSKTKKYWPNIECVPDRIDRLLESWSTIIECIKRGVSELDLGIPDRGAITRLSELKPYEDALDAVVCAYVGALYLQNETEAFGDSEAAIWVPKVRQHCKPTPTDGYLAAVQETLCEWDSLSDKQAFHDS